MYTRIYSYALDGIDARPVAVEVDVRPGLPSFTIVGVGDLQVRESRERVRCALQNQGYELPQRRITVNLAPASLPKVGAGLDLPIALGVLIASQQAPAPVGDVAVVGDLALGGEVRHVRGALPIAEAAHQDGRTALVVPAGQLPEAAIVDGLPVRETATLRDAVAQVSAAERDDRASARGRLVVSDDATISMDDVHGFDDAKRRIQDAAQDARSVLLIGHQGSGRTMLARRIPGLLPPMTRTERVEVTRIHSACGLTDGRGLVEDRPFRAPHHGTSAAGLLGSAVGPRPGEVTLAHRGVLYLDEITAFCGAAVAELREVLRDGRATVVRHGRVRRFPARSMLVASAAPCACGRRPKACRCTDEDREHHDARLDRIHRLFDVVIDLTPTGSEVR